MKILIVNQPINNRGDEAAHKAFVRSLASKMKEDRFKVLFTTPSESSVESMNPHVKNVDYVNHRYCLPRRMRLVIRLAFQFNMVSFLQLYPIFRSIKKEIVDSDYIINAPGGICLGPFRNWLHAYILYLANKECKPVAYYSRSFGPFLSIGKEYVIFNRLATKLLRNLDFLSIRDTKTMRIADELNLNYVNAIDTAFLNCPSVEVPCNLESPYCVFVPNSLTWHSFFEDCDENYIFDLYLSILYFISKSFPHITICLLPQLYNSNISDYNYFCELERRAKLSNVVILPDTFNSDIQQKVVAGAEFCIGARYHSVVFAINNCSPVVSLSYEHKMTGLLERLNLANRSIDLADCVKNKRNFEDILAELRAIIDLSYNVEKAKRQAMEIAQECEGMLIERIKKHCYRK